MVHRVHYGVQSSTDLLTVRLVATKNKKKTISPVLQPRGPYFRHFRHHHFRLPTSFPTLAPTFPTSPKRISEISDISDIPPKDFRHFRQALDTRPIAEVTRNIGHRPTSLTTKFPTFSRQ
jgi:hypothetical protein